MRGNCMIILSQFKGLLLGKFSRGFISHPLAISGAFAHDSHLERTRQTTENHWVSESMGNGVKVGVEEING